MNNLILPLLALMLIGCQPTNDNPVVESSQSKMDWSIAIHGGAGHFDEESYTEEEENRYKQALTEALEQGKAVLESGGSSTDAVVAAITVMENFPLFNAGRGAVFTSEGINEMDASIMWGADLNCGAVTGIQNVKNPILAAREVMNNSNHVFFSGNGATEFARSRGLEMVDSSYFFTDKAWSRYLKVKQKEEASAINGLDFHPPKFGTVGCVALDKDGNLAAGTSTGGMTYKRNGRIGDSPVVAAGTYADNNSCAVSCTGHGEYFIRAAVAHDIAARMEYKKISADSAAQEVVMDKLVSMGGEGGVIVVDKFGNSSFVFNSTGMFRGATNSEGDFEVAMYAK